MASLAALTLLTAASIGAGATTLALLGILSGMKRTERVVWSFATGIGVVGWVLFFVGIWGAISTTVLAATCGLFALGLGLLLREWPKPVPHEKPSWLTWMLCGTIGVALIFDLAEGLSPPADADTLAYHFALPKQFLAAGRVEFVPRAGDGAIPLLVHMTYLAALALGGERALTLWTMLSGWASAALIFVVCRRYIGVQWSLACVALTLTVPAMIYGAGSGQVEARLALFALGSACATSESIRKENIAYAIFAGLLAGFFVGGKYTGLIFLAALGCMFLLSRHRVRLGLVYSLVALVAGGQWYVWNWIHTGDPVFPVLFQILGLADSTFWTTSHDVFYRQIYFSAEHPIPRTVLTYLSYPFVATFGVVDAIEAGRTGLGPILVLMLPFAVGWVWRERTRIAVSTPLVLGLSAFTYFTLWFWFGPSQRVRHLLPVYPAVLICVMIATARFVQRQPMLRAPAATAIGITLAVQLGGHAFYAANFFRYVATNESRDEYLRRNIGYYDVSVWVNSYLTNHDRVLVEFRQLIYLIDKPIFYGHFLAQSIVDLKPNADDPRKFMRQTEAQNITHLLLPDGPLDIVSGSEQSPRHRVFIELEQLGCLKTLARIDTRAIVSRTLAGISIAPRAETVRIVKIDRTSCRV